jgi:uncharacterized repeat protein (TIGR01451 family)
MSSMLRSAPFVLAVTTLGTVAHAQFGPSHQFFCQAPHTVDLSDFDGDGHLDLVVASRSGLGFYRNANGDGIFDEAVILGMEETVACAADVNGDGAMDVVASRENNNGIYWFTNSGEASFGNPLLVAADVSATELYAADLDADGDKDLYFVTADGLLFVSQNTDGAGAFAPPFEVASLVELAYAKALDIDADGDLDLVFSSRVANEVDVCLAEGGWFAPQIQLSVSGHGTSTDLDNDGHSDLMVANTASGQVSWQRNSIDQVGFQTPSMLDQAFNAPEYVTASDLDGDGDRDALVSSNSLMELAWYENTDGLGAFGPRQTVCYGVPVTAIATGDVDHDGDEDLFVASGDLNKVIWYTNLANSTGGLMGRVFNDINSDGIFNGSDHGLMNMRVECGDIGATYTNASGYYWYNAVPTTYEVSKPAEEGWEFTTVDSYTVPVLAQGMAQHNDFGLHADTPIHLLAPDLGSAPMRCGTGISYWATVLNEGNQVSDVQFSVDLDDLSTLMTADPQPSSIVDGVATWVFQNMQPSHQRQVQLMVLLPGSAHVGETLNDVLTTTAYVDGIPAAVYSQVYSPILLCAVDPNDKQVSPAGEGAQHITPVGSTLYYQVRFQNTGNAEAQTVEILDTLDTDLDPVSLRVLNSSHTCHTLVQPDGVLRFTFEGINLPDSGSDALGSQGFVRFEIQHHGDREAGTVINNTADIYFDNNAPVITNTTLNTLGDGSFTGVEESTTSTDDLVVLPNPARGTTTVRLGNAFQGRVDLQLFDVSGALVQQMTRRSSTVLVDQGTLPAGVYLLRASDESGTERTTRVAFE